MRIIVLQHIDVEHPGVFRDFWSEAGHVWTTVELDAGETIPALDGFDLMVVMGGPMDVWEEDRLPWLVEEKAAIRRWVADLEKPFLGICLGHQLLASALGGEVAPMRRPEVGMVDVQLTRADEPLLAGFGATLPTFQWHGAEVSKLPPGAEILAANAACAVQAMRVGLHAYGFQFHCELTASTVPEWREIPAYRDSLRDALGEDGAAGLEAEVAARLPEFGRTARRLDANLMRVVSEIGGDAGHGLPPLF